MILVESIDYGEKIGKKGRFGITSNEMFPSDTISMASSKDNCKMHKHISVVPYKQQITTHLIDINYLIPKYTQKLPVLWKILVQSIKNRSQR